MVEMGVIHTGLLFGADAGVLLSRSRLDVLVLIVVVWPAASAGPAGYCAQTPSSSIACVCSEGRW